MVDEKVNNNAIHLEQELDWIKEVLATRMRTRFQVDEEMTPAQKEALFFSVDPPKLNGVESVYAQFLDYYKLSFAERVVLLLAVIPYIRPGLLDVFFLKNEKNGKIFSEFGGVIGGSHNGFLPTAETALFVICGDNLKHRFSLMNMFNGGHSLIGKYVTLEKQSPTDPFLSGVLTPTRELIDLFTIGSYSNPVFGADFPAKRISTGFEWDDLVLEDTTVAQVEELKTWLEYGEYIMEHWGLNRKLKPGYISLFYGPPGTGKTLTACLLGKAVQRPVYRIDLSMVVSKYIGETEKNLSKIFDQAENKNWILFFDEADALFGKRTKVNDAHDRYANQEVSYLLQRIEDFAGLSILATNLKSNLDEAFTRRFQTMIHFARPRVPERVRLWETAFPEACELEPSLNLRSVAKEFEITGGAIMNVVRYCALVAAKNGTNIITSKSLYEGIKREFSKDGKLI